MAVNLTLTNLANLENQTTAVAAINANNAAITTAFQDALSLDGTLPNAMKQNLDMNSNAIINLPQPVDGQSPLRLQDYNTLLSGGTIYVNNDIGIQFVMDGGGAQLSTGLHGTLQIPFAATITQVELLADQTGSVVVDIWKCPFASYSPPTHPAVADTITGTSIPTLSSAAKYQDSTLTGWTVKINAGDILAFNVNSVTSITRLTLCLSVTKTAT